MIGLDCAAPEVVFERHADVLPNLSALRRQALCGRLRSCHPPITVPAWAVMLSGYDAGELGIYGFRNRRGYDYGAYDWATSSVVDRPMVWDTLAEQGAEVLLLGVPPGYPARPVAGHAVGCFLTPTGAAHATWPPALAEEMARVAPDYAFDVDGHRSHERDDMLPRLRRMTEARFRLARHLVRTRPWDLFAMVEIATDRLHHAYWRHLDPLHPRHDPADPMVEAVLDFYRALDAEIGALLECLGDDTVVLVTSDHGAQALRGGICLNEWLRRAGYLQLLHEPQGSGPLRPQDVDWSRTRAWADGGHYGRVFFNVRGREAQGCVEPREVDALADELTAALAELRMDEGEAVGVAAHRPRDLFREVRGNPPDLIVYCADLAWRALGSVGGDVFASDNDTGPDDANHAWDGIFMLRDSADEAARGWVEGLEIGDVAATILARSGAVLPPHQPGSPIGAAA